MSQNHSPDTQNISLNAKYPLSYERIQDVLIPLESYEYEEFQNLLYSFDSELEGSVRKILKFLEQYPTLGFRELGIALYIRPKRAIQNAKLLSKFPNDLLSTLCCRLNVPNFVYCFLVNDPNYRLFSSQQELPYNFSYLYKSSGPWKDTDPDIQVFIEDSVEKFEKLFVLQKHSNISILNHELNPFQLATLYSSVKIFNYIISQNPHQEFDPFYALIGGNIDILNVYLQNNAQFTYPQIFSALDFRNDELFDYVTNDQFKKVSSTTCSFKALLYLDKHHYDFESTHNFIIACMEYPSLNILKSFTTPRFIVEVILTCKSKYIFSNLTVSQNMKLIEEVCEILSDMKLIEEVCEILSDMKQYEYIRNIVSALNYKHYFNRETMLLKYVYLSPGISEVGLSDQEELQRTSFIQNCLRNSYSTFVDPSLIFKLFCFVRDSPRISDKKNLIDTLLKIKNFDTKLTVEQKVEIFETKQSSELFESIVCMQVPVDLRLRLLKTLNNPYFSINSEIFYDLFFSSIEVVEKITCVNVLGILMNTRSGQYCQELLFALYNLNFIKKIDKIKRLDYDDLVGQIILSKRFSIETTTDEMINYILYYSLISIPLSERTLTSEKYTDLVLKLSKVNSKDYTRIFRNPLYQNLPDWPKIISRDISLLDKLTINEKCCKYLIENKKLDLIQSKTFIISKFAFKDLENYFFDKSNYFEFHQFTESEIEPALSFLEITPKVTNSALKNLTLSRFIPMEISCFEYKNISAVQLSKIVENYLENNVHINRYLAGQIISKEIFFVGNKKYYFEKIDLFPFALQLLLKYIMNLQINFDKSIEIDQIHFCAFCQSNKSNGFVKTVLTKFKINNTSLVNGLGIAINDNNEELVKILIENFDIPKNCFCVDGKTIFHLCFAKDDKELIQYVSDHGFKQGFSDKGYIPKMLNFSMESNPNIKSLLKYPFVPLFTNILNNSGYPSNQKFLVAYARTKNKSFIEPIWNSAKYPVQFHLFVSLFCNDFYYSFFDSELSNEDKEDLIDMLRTYPTEFMNNLFDIMNKTSEKLECDFYIELLYLAIYFGNVDFVDDVLYKMDLDSYDLRMISPICVAVKFDRFAIFKLMVSKKNEFQDVYFAPEDNFKYSKEVNLLEYVIKNERKAMFDLLIEKKFNVNAHGSFEPFLAAFNIFEQNGEKYYVQKLIPLLDIEFEKVKNPSVVSLIEFYKTGEKKFDGDTKYILDLLDSKVPKVLKNQRFVPKWLTKKVTENLKLRGNFN